MIKRTYRNIVKAVDLIMAKGYDREEANRLAMMCFDNREADNSNGYSNGMPVEWYIDKIQTKEEYERECGLT